MSAIRTGFIFLDFVVIRFDPRPWNAALCIENAEYPTMKFYRPKGILSGYSSFEPEESGSVVLEAGEHWVPRDWMVGPHSNAGWEIYYQPAGVSTWKCGEQLFSVPSGGFYLIAPRTAHELVGFRGKEAHYFFAVLRPGCLDGGRIPDWPYPCVWGPGASALETPFRGLIRELTLAGTDKTEGLNCYARALGLEISRLIARDEQIEPALRLHPAVARACELFEGHIAERWRLDELAVLCAVSVPHLISLFRRDTGQTPRQYLLRRRIERAEAMLQNKERPVTEISHELGFSSSQHFATAYRKLRGKPAKMGR
jgi:AraC-like DNA-binding protein